MATDSLTFTARSHRLRCLIIFAPLTLAGMTSVAGESTSGRPEPFEVAGITYAEATEILHELQIAVAANDASAVAALTEFPLTVTGRPGPATASQFARDFTSIYTERVRAAVRKQTVDSLFANWKGIIIGRGEVWIAAVCDVDSVPQQCRNRRVRVVSINN